MKAWWWAARPKTLSAAVVPILIAASLAQLDQGSVDWGLVGLILVSALSIQIGTNFFNDALDFEKGSDRDTRTGPLRVTHAGLLTPKQVKLIGGLFFFVAVISGIPLVIEGGWVIVAIGVFSLLFGYLYTGGPYPLAYKGLGEVFVLLFFGLIAVGGTYFLLTKDFSAAALAAGFQVGLLSTVLIAINNFRDRTDDEISNKRTLAVRFGSRFARIEITFCALAPLLLGLFWLTELNRPSLFWLPLLVSLPLLIFVVKQIWSTEPAAHYNRLLALSGFAQMLFALAFTGAVFLL